MPILGQAGFGIVNLAGKHQAVNDASRDRVHLAEGRELPVPDHGLGRVGDFLRAGEMVGMDEERILLSAPIILSDAICNSLIFRS
jgi:hypothetical protein